MKLYKITAKNTGGLNDTPDSETHWVGSLAEASGKRKQLVSEGFKRADLTTDEVEVPTDKKGLLGFLNTGGAL